MIRNLFRDYYRNNPNNSLLLLVVNFRKSIFKLKHFCNFYFLRILGFRVLDNAPAINKSSMRLDVVYCCIERDLDILKLSMKSVRKYLMHPINKIYLIAPSSKKMLDFCDANDCIFISENENFPFKKGDISYDINLEGNKYDRSGWLLQQLLGLSGDTFCEEDNYFILDSDTVLTRPQVFEVDGSYIFNYADIIHTPYFTTFKSLFGKSATCPVSLTSHMMIFNKVLLADMKATIKINTGTDWFQAMINLIDNDVHSFVSDYENYAQFVIGQHKGSSVLSYWYNESQFRAQLEESGVEACSTKTKSISYHHYN
jgi:hypothetical protein|tara:strand:- start:22766 stop:23704 length:939 start_codon:yes stop_codon:yes gene_type:complete